MVLGSKLFDLLNQFFLRMLNVDLVDTVRGLCSSCTPLARLFPITLPEVSPKDLMGIVRLRSQKVEHHATRDGYIPLLELSCNSDTHFVSPILGLVDVLMKKYHCRLPSRRGHGVDQIPYFRKWIGWDCWWTRCCLRKMDEFCEMTLSTL
jgi:hypothetical protein